MFTGLIQGVGYVAASERRDGDVRLRIAVGTLPFADVALGESIAVNGVCLTAIAFDRQHFDADVSRETIDVSTLGHLCEGAAVNLERALRASDRLGGHWLLGHVDGVGGVLDRAGDARGERWRLRMPRTLARFIASKGSIAVDGVSLTVNEIGDNWFEVMLVPHTLMQTSFGQMPVGSAVNIEVDLVARYVERLMSAPRE
ncbi:MAG: riboflavin synthase [Lysobacterales bacterium]